MAHNEPVERAQEETGKVTARQLLVAARAGIDSLYMHGRVAKDRPSYSDAYVFTVSAVRKNGRGEGVLSETTSMLDVPGFVRNGTTSHRLEHERPAGDPFGSKWVTYDDAYRPLAGFWSIERDELVDILEVVPRDAEVSFEVYLDAGSNEYLIRADCPMNFGTERGLHSDHLYLNVETKGRSGKAKVRRFLVGVHTGPHTPGRFGNPKHPLDKEGGSR